jgi:hypothetical protein
MCIIKQNKSKIFLNWTLFDNPKKKDKMSKLTSLHPSPSRGRRGGE